MDFSTVPTDTDAIGGSSPWGSSSPRANRNAYSTESSPPGSPIATHHAHTNSQDSISANPFASEASATSVQPAQPQIEQDAPIESQQRSATSAQAPQQQQTPPHQHHHPQQEPVRPGAARYHNARANRPVPAYKLTAKVTALERSGRKDPVIRFDVYTNLPKFRTTQFRDVRRTHSEFNKLAEHLISSNPEAMVPAVPPSLTSAGAGTDDDETRVKASIQRWLNTVCSNDVLMRDEEMIFFVESDFGYSPVVSRKQPATGVRRKVLKQFAPPPDDTPELQNARPVVKAFYLGTLDAGQKMERVVKSRRAIALSLSTLGQSLSTLSPQEPHPGLSHAYRKLGRIIQTVGDYSAAAATSEATVFGDPLAYHAGDAFIVKETLTNRHILLRELLQAEQGRKKLEVGVQRLKGSSSVRREKVDEAISALDEAASSESYLRAKTARVTANLLLEKRRWFHRTSNDMLTAIREYAIKQIEAERRTLSTLESVRGDVRSIDASGGLSRLGRENMQRNPNVAALAASGDPAAIRRVSVPGSSQTAKGDSWSGVERSRTGLSRTLSSSVGILTDTTEEDGANGTGSGSGGSGSVAGVGRSRSGTVGSGGKGGPGGDDDGDADRVDARNAASRLAQSTF